MKSSGLFTMVKHSSDSSFLNCLQVRYKPDIFAQYCLAILRAWGSLQPVGSEGDNNWIKRPGSE